MTLFEKIFRNKKGNGGTTIQTNKGNNKIEINEIYKQEPIVLADILKTNTASGGSGTVAKETSHVENGKSDNELYKDVEQVERPKKTIVILDPYFGKDNQLDDFALNIKKQLHTEADVWFLYNKNLCDIYSKCKRDKIDMIILGDVDKIIDSTNGILNIEEIVKSYDEINIKDTMARENKVKNLITNYLVKVFDVNPDRINYVRFRDLWQYARNLSEIIGFKIKVEKLEDDVKTTIIKEFPKPIETPGMEEPGVGPPPDFTPPKNAIPPKNFVDFILE